MQVTISPHAACCITNRSIVSFDTPFARHAAPPRLAGASRVIVAH
jgi:hypothetical protein